MTFSRFIIFTLHAQTQTDFAFDSKTLTPGPNATECSIGTTEISADSISMGNHLRNWTCAVFNQEGSLNASRNTDGMESIHIAFQGAYSKPLVALLSDKRSPHLHRNSEPNWIFSMGAWCSSAERKIDHSSQRSSSLIISPVHITIKRKQLSVSHLILKT